MGANGRKRIYMAGPLFTQAERRWNRELADVLGDMLPRCEFVLPQERADDLLPDLKAVVDDCLAQVSSCDAVLACLDGPDADSGTCVEVGWAMAMRKPVVGYRTDFRASEADGVNAMLRYGVSAYVAVPAHSFSMVECAQRCAAELANLVY